MNQPYTPLAHSVTIRCVGELPYRAVLVDKGNEYVVWWQCFTADSPHTHDSYYMGSYYTVRDESLRKQTLARAWDEFSRRNAQREREVLIGEVCLVQ